MTALRVLDTGLRPARMNLSVTEAIRRARQDGAAPDTLRFQHFPPSAIIGRHQRLAQEVDLPWIAANGVAVARRMTGGGAIVMGPGMLGWELILSRRSAPPTLDVATETICQGVAAGLRRLGAEAAFRPRNDVEVAGRKVCGTGGYFDQDVLVFQGTVLVELDLSLMTGALRLPARKLGKRGLAAVAERVGDLRGALGAAPPMGEVQDALAASLSAALGREPDPGTLTAAEEAAATVIQDAEIGTDRFVHGLDDALPPPGRVLRHAAETPGGTVGVVLSLRGGPDAVVDQALITGDFFVEPPAAVAALEAALRGCPAREVPDAAREALDRAGAHFLGIAREEVVAAIRETVG